MEVIKHILAIFLLSGESGFNIKQLPYSFQSIWPLEMAVYYSFLYSTPSIPEDRSIANNCILSSLYRSTFLHFAGTWPESSLYKSSSLFEAHNDSLISRNSQYIYSDSTRFNSPAKSYGVLRS